MSQPRPPEPKRLGRGLSALLGSPPPDAPIAPPASSLPIELLEPGPFQPRSPIDDATLTELAASIEARGILQPLLARPHPAKPDRFQIIAGERRWRAAQLARLHTVPVLVRALSDSDALAAALVENLQRQDLNAIEEAQGYRRLQEEFGSTQEQLAAAVGKSRSHVANTVRLLGLPVEVRAMLEDGRLTAGHARALLASADPLSLARTVVERGLNVRQTEALTAPRAERAVPAPRDPATEALATDLSAHLGLKVAIGFDGKGGELKIRYQNLDQLDGLLRLLRPES